MKSLCLDVELHTTKKRDTRQEKEKSDEELLNAVLIDDNVAPTEDLLKSLTNDLEAMDLPNIDIENSANGADSLIDTDGSAGTEAEGSALEKDENATENVEEGKE